MKLLRKAIDLWPRFFFAQIPATSLGLFRIAFAAVVLMNLALLVHDADVWFGERGTLPDADSARQYREPRFNVFAVLRPTDTAVKGVLACSFVAAGLVMVGFHTRVASVLLWICLVSLHHRNPFILNSGDSLIRTMSFLLMFAPAGKALSLDRYLRVRHGLESSDVPLIPAWSQRLLQFQVCMMYLSTFLWKISGPKWINGTAVFYTIRLDEFAHYPMPSFVYTLWFARLATWGTLAVEGGMATLVWVPRLRYYVLFCGLLLHLGLEYTMNIPVFQWAALSSFLLFIEPNDLRNVGRKWMATGTAALPR